MSWNSLLSSLGSSEGEAEEAEGEGEKGRVVKVVEDGMGLEVNGLGVRGVGVGIEVAWMFGGCRLLGEASKSVKETVPTGPSRIMPRPLARDLSHSLSLEFSGCSCSSLTCVFSCFSSVASICTEPLEPEGPGLATLLFNS